MKSWTNKKVVVTGAGSGIGRSLAVQLAQKGAILALNDYKAETLEETKQLLPNPEKHVYSVFDVASRDAFQEFADAVIAKFGEVDVVINNAGITLDLISVEKMDWEAFERVININMWGMIYGSKLFLSALKSRPEACIANVSSVFGIIGVPKQAPYCASKFAIRGFTESLRQELAHTNVNVLSIHPGGIKTNIVRSIEPANEKEHAKFIKRFDKNAKTTAEGAASQIITAIERKKVRLLIGSDARMISRITRLFPSTYEKVFALLSGKKKKKRG